MKELDMRKKQCPMPVIEAKKALEKSESGEVVAVRVDNEVAVSNLLKLAAGRKEKAEKKCQGADDFVVEITAGVQDSGVEAQGIKESAETELKEEGGREGSQTGRQPGLVVAISSDQMGEPDAVLGKILMKGFIYALSEQEMLPETMIFYNGGAKLTAQDSDSLEDLKAMEQRGVEIITCGTCLKHFGLEEKLQVGTVSNMYDIVEKMTMAGRVIKP